MLPASLKLRCSLLLLILGIRCWGRLYVYDEGSAEEIPVNFPPMDDIPLRTIVSTLEDLDLQLEDLVSLHFDSVESVQEVLALPKTFFEEYLCAPQLIEIILNDKLSDLISSHYRLKLRKSVKYTSLAKAKVKALHSKMDLLDLQSLGPYHDQVVSRLPTRLYRYISPYVALTSRAFETTALGFKRLFGVSTRGLKSLALAIRFKINQVFESLQRLRHNDRVIRTLAILTPILKHTGSCILMVARMAVLVGQVCALAGVFALKSNLTTRKSVALNKGHQEKVALVPQEAMALKEAKKQWKLLYGPLLQNYGKEPHRMELVPPKAAAIIQAARLPKEQQVSRNLGQVRSASSFSFVPRRNSGVSFNDF